MCSPKKVELDLLYKYALDKNFIVETGGGGKSTTWLAKAALKNNAIMVSIEANPKKTGNISHVEYRCGWSVSFDDIIKKGDSLFVESQYCTIDKKVAFGDKEAMKGETDLIRKTHKEKGRNIDFFFCDTGEYCGLAEWNIIKDIIPVGGIFAIHDIYYPKSVKGFR
ncbi:MAG: hypothetical protein ACOC56_03195, partial [Atribacterota bacterium]